MSLTCEQFAESHRKYNILKDKVVALIGMNALSIDHYGEIFLLNKEICLTTKDSEILEIWNKFMALYKEIKKIFSDNDMELKESYFYTDMSCVSRFLNIPIDVDKGIKHLKHAINDFIRVYKKVHDIATKYNNLGDILFYKPVGPYYQYHYSKNFCYELYNQEIYSNSKDSDIDKILNSYDKLNCRINKLLKLCKYKNNNLLYPDDKDTYYIFGTQINHDTSDEELIEIINKAQLFESRLKLALKDLNIIERYKIEYRKEINILFGRQGNIFKLDASYDKIKEDFIETDRWHHFKKKT